MSLITRSRMTTDHYLIDRAAACAAELGVVDARPWAARHIWALVATPGWVELYAAELTPDEANPAEPAGWTPRVGLLEHVITDAMIRDAVSTVYNTMPDPGVAELAAIN